MRADILQDFATRMWMQLPPKFDKQKLVRESRLLDPYMLLSLRKLKQAAVAAAWTMAAPSFSTTA